jgi:hypothetical protein
MNSQTMNLRPFRIADSPRIRRLWIAVTIGILLGILLSTLTILPEIINQWGEDYGFFVDKARRWVEIGQFYNPHQLAGPYEAETAIDVLYPPVALYLFVPFVFLPAFLWWIVPLGILGWHVRAARPAVWAWPILAVLAWVPRDQSIVIWGSTGMWIGAIVALALRFAWAAPFVLLKPTFAPFALVSVWRKAWWVGLALFALASLSVLPMWPDYFTALRNNVGPWPPGLLYSVPDYLFVAIPIVAWSARTQVRSDRRRWGLAGDRDAALAERSDPGRVQGSASRHPEAAKAQDGEQREEAGGENRPGPPRED